MNQSVDITAILPEIILSGTLVLVLVADAFLAPKRKWFAMPIAFVGVVAALIATLTLIGDERVTFGGMYVVDDFAVLFKTFFLSVALIVLMMSLRYFREGRFYQGEFYFLLLTSFLGCVMMPSSRDLLMLFISLELVSAPGFLIAAFRKADPRSNEAGIKFFLIGVLSTAVMLYGMSLVYGLTGTLNLVEIGQALSVALPAEQEPLVLAAILLVVAGFAFKVSAVPFQFWAPDTYEGAPVPVAAFLATASKAAGFAGLLQLMFVAFPAQHEFWAPIFATLSILTMVIGNFVALQQRQIVRLLAYSSIAQAGYMLLPFALVSADPTVNASAFAAAVTYILIYSIMTLGAFAVVVAMSRDASSLQISDFAGLSRRAPVLAIAMTVFMISLAGIPPLAGFWAKFLVFRVAIERGDIGIVLAIVMLITSVVSLYYYLAVPRQMLFVEPERERRLSAPALVTAVTVLAMVAIVAVGFWPELLAHFPPLATLVE
ncbi:MAG TPA: NADH-quinone oxidoreductase subunit N [Actinomycetota bacterium]|jgi:NADH-quinone oxidoreductase subunit N|nr:NADH-quinone oxidoreductase subunit N [Actinomycetota bacterium]